MEVNENMLVAIFSIIAGLGMVAFIISIAISVLMLVSYWKIFTKAGEDGWKSLIPIYNLVVLYRIAGINPLLILLSLLSGIPVVGTIIVIGLCIYLAYKLAISFGKSSGFTVGLVLVPVIFYPILGLGEATYVGTKYNG